jgi:hypothetical protein
MLILHTTFRFAGVECCKVEKKHQHGTRYADVPLIMDPTAGQHPLIEGPAAARE